MKKYSVAILLIIVVNLLNAAVKEHPVLFLGKENIDRIRKNINDDVFFGKLSENLTERAKSLKLENMPEIDNSWWKGLENKDYVNGIDRKITFHNQRLVPLRYSNNAKDFALTYILTQDKEFALKAKKTLLALSMLKPVNVSVNSGLDYSVASLPAMEAYDLVYDFFDESEHQKMKLFFFSVCDIVKQCSNYWIANEPAGVAISNHDGWHHVCFAMVGLFYGNQELIDRAVNGKKGFESALDFGFQDDGLWLEASLPYSFVQLETMLKIAEMCYVADYKNLYSYTNDDALSLTQLYKAPIELLFPNGMLPSIGDGYGKIYYPGTDDTYELLNLRTDDEAFAYIMSMNSERNKKALFWGKANIQNNRAPEMYSRLWPRHGFAALRSQEGSDYWKGEGNALFASFSNNTCHNHADGLSVMLFAKNHLWLRDSECKPGRAEAFGSNVNQNLNWTTLSHNTVMIDSENQCKNPKPLDLLEFTVLPKVKRLCIGDLNAHLYDGVKQLRTCVVTDDYVLDVFEIVAEKDHKISWITHIDADCALVFDTKWNAGKWKDKTPWTFLSGKKESEKAMQFWETFTKDHKHFRIDISCSKSARYVKTLYPIKESQPVVYIPMRLVEAETDRIVYAVLYRASDEILSTSNITIEEGLGLNWNVIIELDNIKSSHRISMLNKKNKNEL